MTVDEAHMYIVKMTMEDKAFSSHPHYKTWLAFLHSLNSPELHVEFKPSYSIRFAYELMKAGVDPDVIVAGVSLIFE
jgi:hypothetical protein